MIMWFQQGPEGSSTPYCWALSVLWFKKSRAVFTVHVELVILEIISLFYEGTEENKYILYPLLQSINNQYQSLPFAGLTDEGAV